MEHNSHIQLNNLLYACVAQKQRGHEQFINEHAIGYVMAGETHLQTNNGLLIMKAGTMGLVRRNQLIKSVKIPPPGGEFKSVNIFLDQNFLRRYSADNKLPPAQKYSGDMLVELPPDPFLKGYFDSLLPYFNQGKPIKPAMAELKTLEAIELLLTLNPRFNDFLFDFSEPHKIDLEAYMNQNYMYNVPSAQFARLTGRSLAGFKRDFEKTFKTSPGQWLQQKRLNEAYYQIKQMGQKPSEVYLNVGFENLSHFSYVFKKAFGIAPSMI
ncbi:AraC-like DNA-binding protein [Mucilaginibacter gracilis]|uniref:AraC-like DNA-binding protein n=1 Tax=Mucilaginibacter gracilis TaxID=423350 RepID=A0A495J978_9SPHI|nr:AraC family transcriptional regulator [Mucilaginibacter gracilis]RKR84954.1 AraC-like DNA-binding protein [Mucilaginibacter gracilis]